MEYLSGYEHYLETEKNASPNTLSSYLRDVRQYLGWLEEGGLTPVQATRGDLEAYTHGLTARGKSAATVTRYGDAGILDREAIWEVYGVHGEVVSAGNQKVVIVDE